MSQPIEKLYEKKQRYTYADYYTWDDDKRWELIDGVPYAMSPAPSWRHQRISVILVVQFESFLKDKPCKVFCAPFDIRLNADTADDTVVQPDLVIICDKTKLDDKGGYKGVPEMVIEILSPWTARRDKSTKLKLYQKAGVREYWIVDPESNTITVHILNNGTYAVAAYDDENDTNIPVHVLPGCIINIKDVFDY